MEECKPLPASVAMELLNDLVLSKPNPSMPRARAGQIMLATSGGHIILATSGQPTLVFEIRATRSADFGRFPTSRVDVWGNLAHTTWVEG